MSETIEEELQRYIKALESIEELDRSPIPEYGEKVRGKEAGPGKRFLAPREIAWAALSSRRARERKVEK